MKTTILSSLCILGGLFLSSEVTAQTMTMDDEMSTSTQTMMSPKKMMKAIDQNDDKMISMGEAESSDYPMLVEKFEDVDTSKDEMIDMKELKAFHKDMQKDMKKGMNDERMEMKQEVDSMDY